MHIVYFMKTKYEAKTIFIYISLLANMSDKRLHFITLVVVSSHQYHIYNILYVCFCIII